MSKIGFIWATVFTVLFTILSTWYFTIRRPQITAANTFLEALKQRDEPSLKKVTHPDEFEVYRGLYLKNGFNKHLLKYGGLSEKTANGYFFPTQSTFAVQTEENDMFFGKREVEYMLTMKMTESGWKIVQFASLQDYGDLSDLKQLQPVQIH